MDLLALRGGSIALVRAALKGSDLHWKGVERIRRGEADIAIIATGDVLVRSHDAPPQANEHDRKATSCDALLGRRQR